MKSYSVKILGNELNILSDADEEKVENIVDFVNRKMGEAKESAKTSSVHNIAILAALNISEELLDKDKKVQEFETEMRERVNRVIELLCKVGDERISPAVPVMGRNNFEPTDM